MAWEANFDIKSTHRFSNFSSEPLKILSKFPVYEHIPLVSLEESLQPLKSLIPNLDCMVWIVRQHNQQIDDYLTFDESSSLMLYSLEWIPFETSFHFYFNEILRSEDRDLVSPWLFYFKLILTAYLKIPNEFQSIVYRGISMNLASKYPKGQTFVWWGFSSCTNSMDYVTKFLEEKTVKTLFKIESQTGKAIHQYTFSSKQQEILFLPGRQFQIIDNYHEDDDLFIIHLKEIQSYLSFSSPTLISIKRSLINGNYSNLNLERRIHHFRSHGEINLKKLNLNNFDLEIICEQAINEKNCVELLLDENQITSKGILILRSVLFNNRKLKKLVLTKNFIDDLGVRYLSQILATNQTNLQKLDLSFNKITYQGMKDFVDMLKTNQTLISLWLNGNEIENEGVNILMNILAFHNQTLKFLRISSDHTITDDCLPSIIIMFENNRTLIYLDLQNCQISSNGKEILQEVVRFKKTFFLNI